MSKIEDRIRSLGIIVPQISASQNVVSNDIYGYDAHILRYYQAGNILSISGQIPTDGSEEAYKGRHGLT